MSATHHPHRRAVAAVALLCAAASMGCGAEAGGSDDSSSSSGSGSAGGLFQDSPDRSRRFARDLEAMPGVVSAQVEEEVVEGEGIEQLDVEVVVADDADETDVTALLDAVGAYDADLGFDQHHSLVVTREGREDGELGYAHELEETTAELVRRWVLAEDRLDPGLVWTADGYGVVTVTLPESAGAADVTALAEEIGADADLAALPLWTLVADGEEARTYLATEEGMTEELLASWRRAVANLDLGPDPSGTSLTLTPQNTPGGYESDPPPAGSVRLDVGLDLPGVHSPRELTPERWGGRLWPMLRAQLDVVRDFPRGSQFAADNFYTEADGTGGGLDQFLHVTLGRRPSREDPDRGWNVAAARYLADG